MKNKNKTKKAKKAFVNRELHRLQWTCPTGPWCDMLLTFEMLRKYRWSDIVSGTHSLVQNEYFSRNHNNFLEDTLIT